ncbi:MAG: hypothetical protein A3H69_02660 [Candidatus Sungbacteria bacterium RIFCSPLOWO2_02_FULL_47_9]|uniref:Uncharacterized protein n=1 Tax=Candidatus Sungbacteria bacterium RIFCSPHIGHO2_01_FULL_47_32 TaxID=1802264 RepID=A0A1G2K367_9BACT|nr:MAG: hypothetical protein A2633_05175 [Candidatus Sungbacteria bacterium RIFCSPHIGHO2_01_FULL_47_32]OGZ99131.1 MAG: hypothetical protein A3D57_05225 [Candidatus Sungbacteria bacterium RIFCSPHIGHO2_02_FULL_46_12]OHA06007.1 MAG: hypothetical protein A3A28_05235 [Candidatus Sungbacteria bacterium RIFCSPLOWO2_01_FULL_47_32]OHA09647.1 MAG: hypothetical protein A3H69_02660 [Candidatus Sungbacteria bacterium RIFCSPLOWO2_02_FULL_47_9]
MVQDEALRESKEQNPLSKGILLLCPDAVQLKGFRLQMRVNKKAQLRAGRSAFFVEFLTFIFSVQTTCGDWASRFFTGRYWAGIVDEFSIDVCSTDNAF